MGYQLAAISLHRRLLDDIQHITRRICRRSKPFEVRRVGHKLAAYSHIPLHLLRGHYHQPLVSMFSADFPNCVLLYRAVLTMVIMSSINTARADTHEDNPLVFKLGLELSIHHVHGRFADRVGTALEEPDFQREFLVRHARGDGYDFLGVAVLDEREEGVEEVDVAHDVYLEELGQVGGQGFGIFAPVRSTGISGQACLAGLVHTYSSLRERNAE